jgi:hypothetical protein
MKFTCFLLALLLPTYISAQFYDGYYYPRESIDDIRHNAIYYEASPKGFQEFLNTVEINNSLRLELQNQIDVMKSKRKTGNIISYSAQGVGATMMLMSFANEQRYSHLRIPAFVIFAGGSITGLIIKPNKKIYYKFINTFNKENPNQPIYIGWNFSFSTTLNSGIVINF